MKTDPISGTPLNILLVGAGGREHAIAWKLAQSTRLKHLWIAPGNAGTSNLGTNIAINFEDAGTLVRFAQEHSIGLVIIGPEGPLAHGLADAFQAAGIPVFGPNQAAAQIETSKTFAKEFMLRHSTPTARFSAFADYTQALHYLHSLESLIVIKASGLAGGKGVFLPETRADADQVLYDLMVAKTLGVAGEEIVIEERLEGQEISLLAFTDGVTVRAMPPAQDHKRLQDGDLGPNTGGMGAYAPARACPPDLADEWTRSILQVAVDGLRAEGLLYKGVIYAGLILTPNGPKVLEFNCRFGDPETQVLLPLLETDLVEIAEACANGTLEQTPVHWKTGTCVCVVLASAGYPASNAAGLPISGLDQAAGDCKIFHAATRKEGEQTVTAGGRILGVTAWADDLSEAIHTAYQGVVGVHFDGMQYRKDIGARGLAYLQASQSAYAKAGVNIDNGNRAVNLMTAAVRSTYTPSVLAGIGSFGGLYDASNLKSMRHPVLVASTDGIGTKIMLAARAGRYASLGLDMVNHCINDVLVQGGRPLFFLDYFASSRLDPKVVAEIVDGMAEACRAAGCALIGGETAELPGVYQPGAFDVAGTLIGLVEYDQILPRTTLQAGDLLIGLQSSGPHTNGFSLLRKVFEHTPLDAVLPGLDQSLGDVLLKPHRSYLSLLTPLLDSVAAPIKALAHITGGGLVDNIPRILPKHLDAWIHRGSWPIPPLYPIVQRLGNISDDEMPRVFNQGIGMVVVIAPQDLSYFKTMAPEETWTIGELREGDRKVVLE